MRSTVCLVLMLALWLAAGAAPPVAQAQDTLQVYVTRHAERADDGSEDPSISQAGRRRAQALAVRLADAGIDAIYVTGYRRTAQTAAPLAERIGITALVRDVDEAPQALAAAVRAHPAGDAVLIVGHRNTMPGIIQALSHKATPPIADDEYGRLYRIDLATDGTAVLGVSEY